MKKLSIMLIGVMLVLTMTGCGEKKDNSDVTIKESAVGDTAADSDNMIVETEEIPKADAEINTDQEEYINDESEELTCVLPDGFKEYPDEEGLYVYKNFPKDPSTISYVISESDTTAEITKESLKADLEADYLEAYGDQVDIEITEFQNIKIDGRKSLSIKMEYEFKGVAYEQLMYVIYNGADLHVLNFTQEKDGKWSEKFKACADSIAFE